MKTEIKFQHNIYSVTLRDEADKSVLGEIFKHHEYRSIDDVIINAKDPIMDVGAHAGFFTLYARALNSKVKIFALEPEKNNILALEENIQINKIKGVKISPVALAGVSGKRKIVLSADTHNHRLLAPGDEAFYSSNCYSRESGNPGCQKVSAVSFADFCEENKIKKLSLLKMDIEGGEYEVIDFMNDQDYARAPWIIMEYHDLLDFRHDALEQKLRINGFGVQIFPSKFDKKMGFMLARNKRI